VIAKPTGPGLYGFVLVSFSEHNSEQFRRDRVVQPGQLPKDALTFLPSAFLSAFHFSFFSPRFYGFSRGKKHCHSSVESH